MITTLGDPMAKQPAGPLRGEAAWLAAKSEMAKRNDAARNRLEAENAAKTEQAAARRRAIARLEMTNLPKQPEAER